MSAEILYPAGPGNVATLLVSTQLARMDSVADAVFSKRVLLDYLNRKAKKSMTGGNAISGPLMTAKNTTVGSYDDGDTLTTTHMEGFTNFQYPWKQYAVSVNIFGREERVQNAGQHVIHDIVKLKLDQADESLADKLNIDMFAAAPGAKDIASLVTSIDATSTIGSIDSTANSFWQARVQAGGSFSAQGLSDLRTMWYELSKREGAGDSDLLMTTSTIFGFYEGQLVPQQRYEQTNEGNASFMNLMFKTAPMVFDEQATSGVIYFLNSEVLHFILNTDTAFQITEWVKPENKDQRTAQILWAGNLITSNRRKLGKITGVTA